MNFDLLIDLHKAGSRQGPGGAEETKLAISLSGLQDRSEPLKIADIGCGTGASTLVLAESLNAEITAIDLFPEFLSVLEQKAAKRGIAKKIHTQSCSMDDLPFQDKSFDAIWSEGAIYLMGFEKGVSYLKGFLKPGGILALSEITWLTNRRPEALTSCWTEQYPEIGTASEKIRILEEQGFTVRGYFPLPERCWLENYYGPLQEHFESFLARHDSEEAQSLITAEKEEIALYSKYSSFYSYGFYIAIVPDALRFD